MVIGFNDNGESSNQVLSIREERLPIRNIWCFRLSKSTVNDIEKIKNVKTL